MTTGATQQMTMQQFTMLRDIVYQRSGIYFQDAKKDLLESRLSHRLAELGLDDFDQYLRLLTTGLGPATELQELFNRITINETRFFRNAPQLEVFEQQVLPGLLERRKAGKVLRLWSSASSTGEEPYTLAMMVHRTLGVRLGDWRIEILGTDISEKVLATARRGRYPNHAIRSTDPNVVKRYFREDNGFFQLDPTIMSMVRFETLNLKDAAAVQRFGKWDVIFCRNVMIYFDEAMTIHCARLFHGQMNDDAVLFIGHSETLRHTGVPLLPMALPRSFAYTRQPPTDDRERRS